MTKCEEFLDFVDYLMQNCREQPVTMSENVQDYLDALRSSNKNSQREFTKNGKAILQWLQRAPAGMYRARDIAEGMDISSKTVSGAMRKLVADGFVEKVGKEPVVYSITEKGRNTTFNDEGENE